MTNTKKKLFMLQDLKGICNVPYDFHSANLFKNCKIINIYKLYQYRLGTSLKSEKKALVFSERLASLDFPTLFYPQRRQMEVGHATNKLWLSSLQFHTHTCTDNINFDRLTFKDLRLYFCTSFWFWFYVLHLGEPWFAQMSTVDVKWFHCILCLFFLFFCMLAADQCKEPEDPSICLLQLFTLGSPLSNEN